MSRLVSGWMTCREAGALLGVTPRHVRRLLSLGRLRGERHRVNGSEVVIVSIASVRAHRPYPVGRPARNGRRLKRKEKAP
jgi:excisionase family DNA binding protein